MFDYIEMFCNPIRKHVRNGMLSPVEFERQQMMSTKGVHKSRGYSIRPHSSLGYQPPAPQTILPRPARLPYATLEPA